MWKIFNNTNNTSVETLQIVSDWKSVVYDYCNIKLKKYFAEKVAVHFDNAMLLRKHQGLHDNLLEALSNTEKEIQNIHIVFPDVKAFLVLEDYNSILITSNLPSEKALMPTVEYDFILSEENAQVNLDKLKHLQFNAWETLIFSVDVSDFLKGWINYTPNLEKRTELQVKHMLLSKIQNKEVSLMEKINIEENITSHPQYEELYNKIIKIMPKIENVLEEEWKESIVSGDIPKIKINKKTKI